MDTCNRFLRDSEATPFFYGLKERVGKLHNIILLFMGCTPLYSHQLDTYVPSTYSAEQDVGLKVP